MLKNKELTPRKPRNANKNKQKSKNSLKTNNDFNSVAKYLEEINQISLLTREQEIELAKKIKEGDEQARDELVKANLRFVVTIARHYKNNSVPLIDLINEGNTGLMIATRHYDHTKGYHFISYAVWWIRWAIKQSLAEQASLVRLPMNKSNKVPKIHKILESDLENPEEEIKRNLNLEGHELSSIIAAAKAYKSFESPVESDKHDMQFKDLVVDEKSKKPDEELYEEGLRDSIEEMLSTLTEQEQVVLKYRYGLEGSSEMTLREIAKDLKMTKEGIRQIQKRAIERLQQPSRANKLRDYIYVN